MAAKTWARAALQELLAKLGGGVGEDKREWARRQLASLLARLEEARRQEEERRRRAREALAQLLARLESVKSAEERRKMAREALAKLLERLGATQEKTGREAKTVPVAEQPFTVTFEPLGAVFAAPPFSPLRPLNITVSNMKIVSEPGEGGYVSGGGDFITYDFYIDPSDDRVYIHIRASNEANLRISAEDFARLTPEERAKLLEKYLLLEPAAAERVAEAIVSDYESLKRMIREGSLNPETLIELW